MFPMRPPFYFAHNIDFNFEIFNFVRFCLLIFKFMCYSLSQLDSEFANNM